MQLQEIRLMEVLSEGLVRIHPLVRVFGLRLVNSEDEKGKSLREEAGKRLASIFVDLNGLENRAQRVGYWICLEQVRLAREYAILLGTDVATQLQLIERWLDRESYLFVDERWWPTKVPGLLYQQLFNLSVEEGRSLEAKEAPRRWVRQEAQVGVEDESLLRVFAGHNYMVSSVAFSPDGSKIITGSSDNTARLWETASGRLLITSHEDLAPLWDVAFSPDGSKAITGAWDGSVRLWETNSGRELAILRSRSNRVTSVAFSPDGNNILTGAWDGSIQVWKTTGERRELVTLQTYSGAVTSIGFSPDTSLMITCDWHGKVFLWRASIPEVSDLLGLYVASERVEDVYWQDTQHIVLADRGGPHYRPCFYRLKLEGMNA